MEKTTKRKTSKHIGLLLFVLWIASAALIFSVTAATSGTGSTGDNGFGWSWSTDNKNTNAAGTFSASLSGTTLTCTITANTSTYEAAVEGSCGSDGTPAVNAAATTTTATVTNNTGNTIQITGITCNTATVSELAVDQMVENGSSFDVKITASPGNATDTTSTPASGTVTITYRTVENIDVVFYGAANATFTYGDKTVSGADDSVTVQQALGSSLTLPEVTVTSGTFTGWRMGDGSVKQAGATATFNSDSAVYPIVLSGSEIYPYTVSGTTYCFWEDAAYAAGSSGTIILNQDYTLPTTLAENGVSPAGGKFVKKIDEKVTYTVPTGVTLLVPFDAADTLYTTEPKPLGETMTMPTAFRTLTMAEGAKLVINGAMSISGQFAFTNAGGQNGSPSGPLGFVDMESGSNITVNGALYAWGYVIGDGTVTVNSGATVYEYCQMPEYRGGDQSTGMSNKVFPLSQYYIQNVEVKMTLATGANLKTYGQIYASSMYFDTGIQLFGSGGMFELSSGSATKWYDGTTDRMYIEINGAATMNSIELRLQGLGLSPSVNSDDYVLPIHGGFTITVKSGSSLTVPETQDVLLQPGAQIIIEEDSSATVNSNLYIYDAAQWGAYCWYGHSGATTANSYDTPVMPVTYSPTRSYIRPTIFPDAATYPLPTTQAEYLANFTNNITSGDGSLNADKLTALLAELPDASILVNGTLSGNIYTTDGGANIYSTGSGTFTQSATENSSVYQLKQRDVTYDEASSTLAKLRNENTTGGEYTETASGGAGTYYYHADHKRWVKDGHTITDEVTAPTCTEGGYTTHTCTCGYTYTDSEVAANGHTEVTDAAVAATCTSSGLTAGSHCSVCSTVIVAQTEVAANGHTEVTDAAIAATCTTAGKTEGKHCSVCNTVIVTQTEVAALGHSWNDGEVTTAPTFDDTGVMTYTCTICGGTKTESIAQLTAVAKIGSTRYTSLSAAVSAASAGSKIYLFADANEEITVNQCLVIMKQGFSVGQITAGSGLYLSTTDDYIAAVKGFTLASAECAYDAEVVLRIKFYIPDDFKDGSYTIALHKDGRWEDHEGNDRSFAVNEMEPAAKDSLYWSHIGVASGEMGRDVTVTVKDADGEMCTIYYTNGDEAGTSFAYNVRTYISNAVSAFSGEQLAAVKALAVYGGYAQQYFDVDADAPVYSVLGEDDAALTGIKSVSADSIDAALTVEGSAEGISVKSLEPFLDSATYLRVKFILEEGRQIDDYSFNVTGPDVTGMKLYPAYDADSGRYYVDIPDIPAAYWDDDYTITVNDTYSVKVSVMLWAKNVISKSTNENQVLMAKALYLYGSAASALFKK